MFGNHPLYVWKDIFNACKSFLEVCYSYKNLIDNSYIDNSNKLYAEKTLSRLSNYSKNNNFDLDEKLIFNGINLPSLNEIILDINKPLMNSRSEFISVIHGDFCFSNILFNFRTQSIKVIDPRGLDYNGNLTIYGDIRYDIAKLSHSVIGLYDYIVSGCYELNEISKYNVNFRVNINDQIIGIQNHFKSLNFIGKTLDELNTSPILIHLFLSMLPLHNDYPDRQKAFLANALRLYSDFKSLND